MNYLIILLFSSQLFAQANSGQVNIEAQNRCMDTYTEASNLKREQPNFDRIESLCRNMRNGGVNCIDIYLRAGKLQRRIPSIDLMNSSCYGVSNGFADCLMLSFHIGKNTVATNPNFIADSRGACAGVSNRLSECMWNVIGANTVVNSTTMSIREARDMCVRQRESELLRRAAEERGLARDRSDNRLVKVHGVTKTQKEWSREQSGHYSLRRRWQRLVKKVRDCFN